MSDHNIIYITFADKLQAEQMAELLLDANLIACANILPAHEAIYKWKGKIEKESEVLMLAKTTKSNFEKVEALVKQNHSYDTPCIIALDIENGNNDFLDWIDKSVS